jgi:cysteine desulfurase
MKELYLDANAHIPINQKALTVYNDFSKSSAGHGHPSSPSLPGRLAASSLEIARGKIASLIGAEKPGQIIFTSTCTQACEWGLEILFNILQNEKYEPVALSPVEHPAVSSFFDGLTKEEITYLKVNRNGIINTDNEYNKVCCIHMQNEIGIIQPIKNIKKKYLFSDMSQSLGKIPVDVTNLGVDIAVFGAHKFGGPGGLGFIYLKNVNHWESFGSGSRYFLDRSGTPDVAGAVATAVALEGAISTLEKRIENMKIFQYIIEREFYIHGFDIIGAGAERSPNTSFINIPGKGLDLLLKMGENGIYTGLGSACGSLHSGSSPLMTTLGREGNIHDFIRISQFGEYGEEDAKYFIKILDKCL